MSKSLTKLVRLGASLSLLGQLAGCMSDVGDADVELGSESQALSLLPDIELAIKPLTDPLGTQPVIDVKVTEMIDNDREYFEVFGHRTPETISYAAGDRVLVYSAGVQPTTGYAASLVSAVLHTEYGPNPGPLPPTRPFILPTVTRIVNVRAHLDAPGVDCVNAPAQTLPYAVGVIRTPVSVKKDDFFVTAQRVDCGGPTCDDIECADGTHCEMQDVVCVRAPCPPLPRCVADEVEPEELTCGGLVAGVCPGMGECVDRPNDDCDPRRGGSDCIGICACDVISRCVAPLVWDGSAGVCDCVEPGFGPQPL